MAYRKPGISKATGYRSNVFSVVSDMRGMINAYGLEFVLWTAYQLATSQTHYSNAELYAAYMSYQMETGEIEQ